MALSRDQKEAQVQELTEKMGEATSIMFANFIGLTVAEVSDLRNKLREANAEMKVAKKTLTKIAAKGANLPELPVEDLDGPVSLIFSFGDPLSGAQIAFKFSKDHEQVKLIGGVFDGKILTLNQSVELAKMPSRDVLLATFAAMIRSPLVKFASMCGSPLSGFARALKQMSEKGGFRKEETAAETPEKEASAPSDTPTSEPTPAAETPESPQPQS